MRAEGSYQKPETEIMAAQKLSLKLPAAHSEPQEGSQENTYLTLLSFFPPTSCLCSLWANWKPVRKKAQRHHLHKAASQSTEQGGEEGADLKRQRQVIQHIVGLVSID